MEDDAGSITTELSVKGSTLLEIAFDVTFGVGHLWLITDAGAWLYRCGTDSGGKLRAPVPSEPRGGGGPLGGRVVNMVYSADVNTAGVLVYSAANIGIGVQGKTYEVTMSPEGDGQVGAGVTMGEMLANISGSEG